MTQGHSFAVQVSYHPGMALKMLAVEILHTTPEHIYVVLAHFIQDSLAKYMLHVVGKFASKGQ